MGISIDIEELIKCIDKNNEVEQNRKNGNWHLKIVKCLMEIEVFNSHLHLYVCQTFVYLSVCLSMLLSVCLFLFVYFSVFLAPLFVGLSICVCVCVCVCVLSLCKLLVIVAFILFLPLIFFEKTQYTIYTLNSIY